MQDFSTTEHVPYSFSPIMEQNNEQIFFLMDINLKHKQETGLELHNNDGMLDIKNKLLCSL